MKGIKIGLILGSLMIATGVYAASDYSNYSIDELANMRGTLKNATQEERNAFRAAWQEKIRALSPEERQAYTRGGQGSGPGRRGSSYNAGGGNHWNGYHDSMAGSHGRGRCGR
ncbi:hypothetical protein [Dissulfuribacter thermophilus]|nr:hypothetical protein [Dissulfuribacter thermophilus]